MSHCDAMTHKSNEIWMNLSHFLGNRKSQDEFNQLYKRI